VSAPKKLFTKKLDLEHGVVEMIHGSGGRAMAQLIHEVFAPAFDNPWLRKQNDQATLEPPLGKLVLTTDTYVVSPLFFPGGDIGSLAVHGTVNDLAMGAARPLYLTAGFILEEGLKLSVLSRVVESMAKAATAAGVAIVTGDTKVVERGKGDGIFINTAGLGVLHDGVVPPSGERARPGDKVIVSGTIGDHGVAILSTRESLSFETEIRSDSAPLGTLVAAMLRAVPDIHVLRDPTRGGLAATLNELAHQSGVGMRLDEPAIPVLPEVNAACELLGIDPLDVANEGKLIAIVAARDAERLVTAMKEHPLGRRASIIGEVNDDPNRFVTLDTSFGGRRVIDWPTGEPLPRIC
jgi:hydrogenase expression/formation protein HypE